ncbi:MATE family efflux transporter [Tissierella creatinophila]|uniref:MATE family efflux transporter n=1 Tax=Tissierella creatinophila TaxID=79681 RepID=UPI000951E727|nr:MATE family efflux transporter [Tissierella creatinophila]
MKERSDLLEGDIKKIFLKYLIPSVGGMLGISLYILGDTIIIGRGLGSIGLAALNVSIPINNILNGVGLLFGIGGATALSIDKGRRDEKGLNDIFSKSMIMAFIAGVIFTFIRIFFLDELCYILGASEDTIAMVKDYLGVLMSFSIAFLLNVGLTIFVRNDGAPKLAMIGMLTGSLMNVILDYIFVFKFKWGMAGAAFATGLAPIIGLIILSTHFIKKNNTIKFIIPKPNWNIIRRIISNGGSSFLVELSGGIVIFAFNLSLSGITGDIGISAYSIIANLSLIFASIFIGIGQALQPIVSYNYGAGKMDRVYETAKLSIYTSVGLGIIFYSLGLFFPKFLVSLFIDADKELLEMTIRGIRLYFLVFIFMGLNIVLTSYIQSKEHARVSLIISLGRGFVFIVMVLGILPRFIGIDGVWLTLPIAEFITIIISMFYFTKYRDAIIYSIRGIKR